MRAAAAELRRRIRTEAEVRDSVGRALGDESLPANLRSVLAAVLGTLPEPAAREWLVRAARVPGLSPEVLAWTVRALAARHEWEGDDVFHGMDNPDVVETPGGLQLCVSAPVDAEEPRALLRSLLASSRDEAVLDALVAALRPSVEYEDVRTAFEQRLGSEPDRGRVADLGAALARWSVHGPPEREADRLRIGRSLFGLAEIPENAGLRLALQPYAATLSWPGGQGARLAGLARGGSDFDQRYWAIDLLGMATGRLAPEERTEAGRMLAGLAGSEPDDKLRERAAAALSAYGEQGAPVLLRIAREDRAWHVRRAAVLALGRLDPSSPDAAAVLEEAAARDPDESVREAAREALTSRKPR